MDKVVQLRAFVEEFGTSPTLKEMERRGLREKGIDGPTEAHVIEELHTPVNFAYITATTGTSAFQNLVGVVKNEIPGRISAVRRLFELCGLSCGCRLLITYPPLVSVFSREALDALAVKREFMLRSQRDAFILAICENKPEAVVGESTFLRAALEDAKRSGYFSMFPEKLVILAAGTPLDMELLEVAKELPGCQVHDLYGCQEFGMLTLDGIPLREDIFMLEDGRGGGELLVGGLPTGDRFILSEKGHICNREGKIITYSRARQAEECQVIIRKTTAQSGETARRLARTILRIKAKLVLTDPELETGAERTQLLLRSADGRELCLDGPEKTGLFDCLLEAQKEYQAKERTNQVWEKER